MFRHDDPTDDPTDELDAAWGTKEQLRRLLKTTCLVDAHEANVLLGRYVQVAHMPETDRLWNTVCQWWAESVSPLSGVRCASGCGYERVVVAV